MTACGNCGGKLVRHVCADCGTRHGRLDARTRALRQWREAHPDWLADIPDVDLAKTMGVSLLAFGIALRDLWSDVLYAVFGNRAATEDDR